MATKPSVVYLMVNTPDRSATVQTGQQPATMACYPCPIEGTIEDTIKAAFVALKIPPGSTILATTDARVDAYKVVASLEAAPTGLLPLGIPTP